MPGCRPTHTPPPTSLIYISSFSSDSPGDCSNSAVCTVVCAVGQDNNNRTEFYPALLRILLYCALHGNNRIQLEVQVSVAKQAR